MKNRMLKKFMDAKEKEITGLLSLEDRGGLELNLDYPRPDFAEALKKTGPALIAEYKSASPSKGVINSALSASDAVDMFVRGGADAFSVLTEKDYFQGKIDFLEVFASRNIPVLRKDFLFHPAQIKQTAATKAAALLLIVRVVQEQELLNELVRMSFDYKIEPVVEIFNEQELDQARKAGARVILINNRDLDTLVVDLNISKRLAMKKKPDETWICASGIEEKSEIDELHSLGFEAFLIGTSIMSSDNPEMKLRNLRS